MFGQAPLSRGFILAYAHDPAFETDRHAVPGMDDEAREAAEVKYMEEFRRCVEAQDFKPLCRGDERPTVFRFRMLRPTEVDKFMSMSGEDGSASWIAFRIALQGVENASDEYTKYERGTSKTFGQCVTPKSMDVFGAMSMLVGRPANELVYALGSIVIERSTLPNPL